MRLNEKKNILNLLNTIEEGLKYAINKKGVEANSMLEDCTGAIEYIGTKLGDELSKSTNNISIQIKSMIEKINNTNLLECIYNDVITNINKLKNIIINEINTKLEIVFMPYKSSMWDSMESVWNETESDINCSCYVVPIPYYELDEFGNKSKVCYEGYEFPKNIKITPFNLYDLETRQPDIIYIHNPYDDKNRLTRVHETYFSENLAKYTDMLVYIPYFVAGSYENKIEHNNFINLPGIKNSTKIIVQSRNEKELYISSGYNPEKILNLGSPKFDATLNSLKTKNECIETWGGIKLRKKVFLLSTGITNLLIDDKKWIRDINRIINIFKVMDDCTLIWRFHPLTEVTINTMRPNIEKEFNYILNNISEYSSILIDDNIDAYSAISISDALISDYSSIMLQYMVTQKPILGMVEKDLLKNERIYSVDYLGNYFIERDLEVEDFIDMVLKDLDPKKEERIKRLKQSATNIDGTCGSKVHKCIKIEAVKSLSLYYDGGK